MKQSEPEWKLALQNYSFNLKKKKTKTKICILKVDASILHNYKICLSENNIFKLFFYSNEIEVKTKQKLNITELKPKLQTGLIAIKDWD